MSEPGMGKKRLSALLAALVWCVIPHGLAAETLKIASPIRGSWEGAIPELGKQAGLFRKYDLDLDILYTQGGGETLQVVMSGSVDIGLSAGVLGSLGAYGKGAPLRIVGASSTGSRETFWWVAAKSPLQSMREVDGQSIAYSTTGASSHITVLRFISEYGLKAKPVATGDVPGTITQVMSGQVDIGWSVAPFVLDLLSTGAARMIGRASDIAAIREQTIRVQITESGGQEGCHRPLHEGVQRDGGLDVFQPRGRAALPRVLGLVGAGGAPHAAGVHSQGEPADRKNHGIGREHEGRGPVQVLVDAA
jgi:NitT/TauT family transport system substrate-binding protein